MKVRNSARKGKNVNYFIELLRHLLLRLETAVTINDGIKLLMASTTHCMIFFVLTSSVATIILVNVPCLKTVPLIGQVMGELFQPA